MDPENMRTAFRSGILKDSGFLACVIFFCLGAITCILSAIPLILCSTYRDRIMIGLSEDLKIAGAGFLIFGLLVVVSAVVGMIYLSYVRRRKQNGCILEEPDEVGYSHPPGFKNPTFGRSDFKQNKLKDVLL